MKTLWQEREIDLTCGLDFSDHMSINAHVTRLQHRPFSYKIKVKNNSNRRCKGTVRIFLAPKYDEKGSCMLLIDQKRLFIELDKFEVTLPKHPQMRVIERESKDSYVTFKTETSFREIEESLISTSSVDKVTYDDFCGCGWPQNMLIPKGSADGFPCQLFVMISNDQNNLCDANPDGSSCSGASSYCGARDKLYPDRRPMGFPFDRLTDDWTLDTLDDFVKRSPNMAVEDVNIVFEGGK